METAIFEPGGYHYIRGPFQYSGGVAALPGYAIERVRFTKPHPIKPGFEEIEEYLSNRDLPLTSFCACEMRSPAPFDDAGFIAFNRIYVDTLESWGIFKNEENPVARSNVCPEIHPPQEPVFEAFCHTIPATDDAVDSFVIAGSGEAQEAPGDYAERIVRLGETTPDAMEEKAVYVLDTMEKRMRALGFGWTNVRTSQVYTVHDLYPFFASQIVGRGAAEAGLTWYYARPPVVGLEYEMDVRCVSIERLI